MGTTKLTRKEILGEDPIHDALISFLEMLRTNARGIAVTAAGLVLVAIGIYFGLGYLKTREMAVQLKLSRGMDFYHAQIDSSASEDPFAKGSEPLFRNEPAKYQAASTEFSSIVSGNSKASVIARYYLALCQIRMGQKAEALKNLESVKDNTKDRTIGYLGKKSLARYHMDSGNHKGAQAILEGMIKDPQCELPKEELKLELSRTYAAQGKRDEALKTLREARDESTRSAFQSLIVQELSRLEANPSGPIDNLKPNSPRP